MADKINVFKVNCIGGLDTNRDVLSQGEVNPGSAIKLINYEPSISGGYRRISGYRNDYGTVPGIGKVLGVAVVDEIDDGILACRATVTDTDYLYSWNATTESWDAISVPTSVTMTGVKKIRFVRFNWGAPKVAIVDGINPAAIYDGSTYTQITSSLAPSAPKYVATFKNHLFLAGDPSEPYNLYFSSPVNETNFDPANGSGVINVGFEIVQIRQFRDILYIFGKNSIKSLTGNSIGNFILTEVTTNLGCLVPDSVIELGGGLIFLGPDGFRPIAGTANFNDVEIQTISKQIQSLASDLLTTLAAGGGDPETLSAVVVRRKSQFRLLSSEDGVFGILGGLRGTSQGIQFEYTLLSGILATCADSGFISSEEFVIHGTADGKVHRQETGTSFGGSDILSVYQTPYYYMQDPTTRKNFYNVHTFLRSEGTANIVFSISYDFEDSVNVYNPSNFNINTEGAASYYNEAVYDSTAIYDGNPSPVVKTNFSGSGFSIAFKYVTSDQNASHTIQGLVFSFATNDKR